MSSTRVKQAWTTWQVMGWAAFLQAPERAVLDSSACRPAKEVDSCSLEAERTYAFLGAWGACAKTADPRHGGRAYGNAPSLRPRLDANSTHPLPRMPAPALEMAVTAAVVGRGQPPPATLAAADDCSCSCSCSFCSSCSSPVELRLMVCSPPAPLLLPSLLLPPVSRFASLPFVSS